MDKYFGRLSSAKLQFHFIACGESFWNGYVLLFNAKKKIWQMAPGILFVGGAYLLCASVRGRALPGRYRRGNTYWIDCRIFVGQIV